MSIVKWDRKYRWDSSLISVTHDVDTDEYIDNISILAHSDLFNNSDLSTIRWNVISDKVTATELEYLELTSVEGGSIELQQLIELPEIFTAKLTYSDIHSGSSIGIKLTDSVSTIIVSTDTTTCTVSYNGTTIATISRFPESGSLLIEKLSASLLSFTIMDSNGSAIIYYGNLTIDTTQTLSIYATVGAGKSITVDSLIVSGYPMTIGEAAYEFTAIGRVNGIYIDADQGPSVQHLIQISPNGDLDIADSGVTWYGANGEDTYFTSTDLSITDIPISSSFKYYYRIIFMPAQYEAADVKIAYTNFVAYKDALISKLGNTNFSDNITVTNPRIALASYLINVSPTTVKLAYCSYSPNLIPLVITDTDYFWTLRSVTMYDDQVDGYYIDTSSMTAMAIYSEHTGILIASTSAGDILVPSGTFTVFDKGNGTSVILRSVGTTHITTLGVMGIWL